MKKKIIVMLVLVGSLAGLYFVYRRSEINVHQLTPSEIRSYLLSYGRLKAALIFMAIYAVSLRPFVPVPPTLMTIVGGFTFGPWLGTLLVDIGATLNASFSFLLARWLGKDFVEKLSKGWLKRLNELLEKASFKALLLIRLSPVGPPFDAVSYTAGLLRVPFWSYFFATALGILPAVFVYTYLGGSITKGALAILAGIFLVALASIAVPWYLRRRKASAPRATSSKGGKSDGNV